MYYIYCVIHGRPLIYYYYIYTHTLYIYRPDDLDGADDDDSDEVDEDDNVILEYSSSLGEWMVR